MSKDFQSMCRIVRSAKLTLHDLRSSAITNWAQRLPIQGVQQLAGHSDILTTTEYHLSVPTEDLISSNVVLNSISDSEQDD